MVRNVEIELGESYFTGKWAGIIHIADVGGLPLIQQHDNRDDAAAAAQTFAREEGWTVKRVFNSDD